MFSHDKIEIKTNKINKLYSSSSKNDSHSRHNSTENSLLIVKPPNSADSDSLLLNMLNKP